MWEIFTFGASPYKVCPLKCSLEQPLHSRCTNVSRVNQPGQAYELGMSVKYVYLLLVQGIKGSELITHLQEGKRLEAPDNCPHEV